MIRILYFGVLKERLGCAEEQLAWSGGSCADLLAALRARGPQWADALAEDQVFRMVVDQEIVPCAVSIADGAEVGILPPVTGG